MKAKIDPELCIGCGACVDICPDVFDMPDEVAECIVDVIPEELEDDTREAAGACPTDAIIIEA